VPVDGVTAATSAATDLVTADVDEPTVYSHDEETFNESTLEQRTTFDQRLEQTFEQRQPGVEAYEEEIVEQVSGYLARLVCN